MNEWVMVPREPTISMLAEGERAMHGLDWVRFTSAVWQRMLAAAPAAPQEQSARRADMAAFAAELKADPVRAQAFFQSAGIIDERGELTAEYGGAKQAEPVSKSVLLDQALSDESVRRVSAFVQANSDEAQRLRAEIESLRCGVELRDSAMEGQRINLTHLRAEVDALSEQRGRLLAEIDALHADAYRYRWLRNHSTYTTVQPCIHGVAAGPSRMRWYHDSYQLQAFTLDAAIDAARAAAWAAARAAQGGRG